MVFPPDGEWFAGHFPGFPILPGVAQLFFLRLFSLRAFGEFPGAASYRNVKFKRPIRPGERVRLKAERRSPCSLSFEYSVAGDVASSGTVQPL
jgi:3-hydroxymyristoyl/3-hydroxydecanoyl-(acyl carrier protein) dehydratase